MRRLLGVSVFLSILAVAWALAGCRGGEQTAAPPPTTMPPTSTTAPTATGATLGTEQAAGPFQVTLSTEPAAPKVGDTHFELRISRGGQPVTDATVQLSLSMPSMNMAGPEATLESGGEHYHTTAKLGMAGEWEARVTVTADGESGTATYRFSVAP
ncbi:MAG TPA: FixH family protein [Chthonomonadales bacterium]|nr:FixH family protein [Chthonomonadales bacterium]